jgi:phospho-N-acetylmuramoyl-pentapeptide-transferase
LRCLDDYLIATRGKNLGLRAREKLALQFIFATAFVVFLYVTAVPGRTTVVRLWNEVDFGAVYYAAGVLFIVALSNAVNFMDGLDGLAAGVCCMVALALAATVYGASGYAWLPMFGGALSGACAGFLWFNAHPAQVFMGDTGSLAMGAAIAGMAMMGKAEGAVQLYSVVPWCALFSVIVQVSVFKYRARRYGMEYAKSHRVFRRTPIHHHFEELGWPETRIVHRFWLITALVIGGIFALGAGR